jgi:hypothetical protein
MVMAKRTALQEAARLLMESIAAEGNARKQKAEVLLKAISSGEQRTEEGK